MIYTHIQTVYEFSFDLIWLSQGFIIVSILFYIIHQKAKGNPNRFLLGLGALIVAGVINSYLIVFNDRFNLNFLPTLILFLGPTLHSYLKSTLGNQLISAKDYLTQLLPGGILLIFSLFGLNQQLQPYLTFLLLGYLGVYLILSHNTLAAKKVVVLKVIQKSSHSSRDWVNKFNLVVLLTFVFLTAILETFFLSPRMQYRYVFIAMAIGFSFLIIRFILIKVREVYRFYKKRNEIKEIEKYKDSILSKSESRALAKKLEELMLNKKPFLDDELDLASLALLLKTHAKSLSQVINENFNRNFFDYVNTFRIEEAKRMLLDPKYSEYKIYEVMYEVGFNSRSSFNSAFKKVAGVTAKQFRAQHQ